LFCFVLKHYMMRNILRLYLLLFVIFSVTDVISANRVQPILGIENIDYIVRVLHSKRIALVVNQSSVVGVNQTHLLDTLLKRGVKVVKVFSPEHGFRGKADAAAAVNDSLDVKTHTPIISLFGKKIKPTSDDLKDVDIVVYDIQDVGLRFYTYISTMHYVMEACAQYGKQMMILDRPNPNDFVDGPMMEDGCQSFIGVDYIPMLYGMTPGELALMINGEGWLKSTPNKCRLKVVRLKNWRHGDPYSLPIKASPNLPNDQSIRLYASICIMGPTNCSVGRGTDFPFQVIGFPDKKYGDFCFIPRSIPGAAMHPIYEGMECYGVDLRQCPFKGGLTLKFLFDFYEKSGRAFDFIKDATWFSHLIGNTKMLQQMREGRTAEEIRASWQPDLKKFKRLRSKYLLYPDYKLK